MKLCKTVKLYFENNETRNVLISKKVKNEEIEQMGLDQYFNLGTDDNKNMQLCIKVEIQ